MLSSVSNETGLVSICFKLKRTHGFQSGLHDREIRGWQRPSAPESVIKQNSFALDCGEIIAMASDRPVAASSLERGGKAGLDYPWACPTESKETLMMTQSLTGLPAFLSYFATAISLLAMFLLAYLWITPYREISLIREGNAAAAASLSGALMGFVLPLASAIVHSVSLLDMAVWGLIALIIQLLAYLAARLLLPNLARDIPGGQIASGVFLAALSLAIGLLNAACMTY